MKVFGRALSLPGRPDLRKTETLIRLAVLLAVLAAIGAAFLLGGRLSLGQAGYGGVALAALVGSASFVLPVPTLGALCVISVSLNPLFLGLIAGAAESVGELTGYFLGYSGRGVVSRITLYHRFEGWMRRRGWVPLLLVSLVPNPIFDVLGLAAGALRYPIWSFLGVVWVGKTVKFVTLAYACAYSIGWLTDTFVN